jgi:tRNA(Ile)-lysidine synthase
VHHLARSVLDSICRHDLLRAGDRAGVAVSGGADSVALLRILLELRRELGIVLSVVHLNHKLRGNESDEDEQFVRELAAGHDLLLISENCDVKSHAARNKLSLETAARELRYEFFKRVLRDKSLGKIATAHTLDDQAETVLLKLARGAGTRGLAGIYPKINIQHSPTGTGTKPSKAIVRPLLEAKRSEIESYLGEIGQSWREDSSNRELRHTRNRIRHEILPRIEALVNPRAREALADAAKIARAEEEFWARKISRLLPRIWKPSALGGSLNVNGIGNCGPALRRRLVRAAAHSLGLSLEFQHVEEVLRLGPESDRTSLPEGWSAAWESGGIIFERDAEEPADYEYLLPVPGKVEVPEAGVLIEASLVSKPSGTVLALPGDGCLIASRRGSEVLVIRNWRAGDRFWPAHAKAPRKLKELLQSRHITGAVKKLWPVIASGGEVIWVRGMGVERNFRATGGEGVLIYATNLR